MKPFTPSDGVLDVCLRLTDAADGLHKKQRGVDPPSVEMARTEARWIAQSIFGQEAARG